MVFFYPFSILLHIVLMFPFRYWISFELCSSVFCPLAFWKEMYFVIAMLIMWILWRESGKRVFEVQLWRSRVPLILMFWRSYFIPTFMDAWIRLLTEVALVCSFVTSLAYRPLFFWQLNSGWWFRLSAVPCISLVYCFFCFYQLNSAL